mgnify:CR=1 FL=1|jgi:hypothetical protein
MFLGVNLELLSKYNITQKITIDLVSHPHILLTGASGSGKSYALKMLIYSSLKEKVEITFCNFKNSCDFKIIKGYDKYFTYLDCANGLNQFYEQFKTMQASDFEYSKTMHILIFDEYPAFIMSESLRDKKQADIYKQMISELLMLGRSYGFGIWLVMQRPDSTFLANGARDNFQTTISLGNLSKEAKSMLYSGEDLPNNTYTVGEGICYIDGKGLLEIKYPHLNNEYMKKLNYSIQKELYLI